MCDRIDQLAGGCRQIFFLFFFLFTADPVHDSRIGHCSLPQLSFFFFEDLIWAIDLVIGRPNQNGIKKDNLIEIYKSL